MKKYLVSISIAKSKNQINCDTYRVLVDSLEEAIEIANKLGTKIFYIEYSSEDNKDNKDE